MLKLSIHNRFVILSDGSRFCEPQPKDLRPRSHHHNRSPRSTTEPHLPSANTTTELSSRPKHRGLMRCAAERPAASFAVARSLPHHRKFVILSEGSRFCEPQPKDLPRRLSP